MPAPDAPPLPPAKLAPKLVDAAKEVAEVLDSFAGWGASVVALGDWQLIKELPVAALLVEPNIYFDQSYFLPSRPGGELVLALDEFVEQFESLTTTEALVLTSLASLNQVADRALAVGAMKLGELIATARAATV